MNGLEPMAPRLATKLSISMPESECTPTSPNACTEAPGRIPVLFEYGEDVAALNLPAGSQARVAIYTESFQVFAILRKILLRINSWENYIFMP